MECYLNCHKPQDVVLRSVETGVTKKAMAPFLDHYRCWKERLQNAKDLPAGVRPDPTNEETKEWFHYSFCFPQCILDGWKQDRNFLDGGNV